MIIEMDTSSSTRKKRVAKSLESKVKRTKTKDAPPVRRLNEDMIEKMQEPGLKSRRLKQHLPRRDQLEDKYRGVRDVWRKVRGYELFIYFFT